MKVFVSYLGFFILMIILGLVFFRADSLSELSKEGIKYSTEWISGEIVSIDEDSFAIASYGYAGANFEFEHIIIKTFNGKTYKLLFPGPSNYQVGDGVSFQYKKKTRISFEELVTNYGRYGNHSLQNGYFDVDGIVILDGL